VRSAELPVATGPGDAVQEPCLTIERDRCRLVEATHAFLQLAFAHESPPLEPESEHLELRGPKRPAQLDGARRQSPRLDRVLVQRNRDVPLVDGEPAVIDPGLETVDEAVRALEPAVGNRRLAVKQEAVGGKPGGDSRRGALVAALEVQAVGTLPGVKGEPVLVQHVANPAHPFERLWGLALGQGLLEGGPRTLPVPAAESHPARVERGFLSDLAVHLLDRPLEMLRVDRPRLCGHPCSLRRTSASQTSSALCHRTLTLASQIFK
jgi:hypothetical protein